MHASLSYISYLRSLNFDTSLQRYPISKIPKTRTKQLVTETRYTATCPVTLDQASEYTEQTWQPKPQKEKDMPPAGLHQSLQLKEETGGCMDSTQTSPSHPNLRQSNAHSLLNHEPRIPSPLATEETHGTTWMDRSLKEQKPQSPGQGIGFVMKEKWSLSRTLPEYGLKSRKGTTYSKPP